MERKMPHAFAALRKHFERQTAIAALRVWNEAIALERFLARIAEHGIGGNICG